MNKIGVKHSRFGNEFLGIYRMGKIENIFNLPKTNKISKNQQGYVLVPYIPINEIEIEFKPVKNMMSRYSTKSINKNFYQKINIEK
jgi:hypothetical protein